jgi:predicted transcriptional regulator
MSTGNNSGDQAVGVIEPGVGDTRRMVAVFNERRWLVIRALVAHGPATCDELAELTALPPTSIRPPLRVFKELGLVDIHENSGRAHTYEVNRAELHATWAAACADLLPEELCA